MTWHRTSNGNGRSCRSIFWINNLSRIWKTTSFFTMAMPLIEMQRTLFIINASRVIDTYVQSLCKNVHKVEHKIPYMSYFFLFSDKYNFVILQTVTILYIFILLLTSTSYSYVLCASFLYGNCIIYIYIYKDLSIFLKSKLIGVVFVLFFQFVMCPNVARPFLCYTLPVMSKSNWHSMLE